MTCRLRLSRLRCSETIVRIEQDTTKPSEHGSPRRYRRRHTARTSTRKPSSALRATKIRTRRSVALVAVAVTTPPPLRSPLRRPIPRLIHPLRAAPLQGACWICGVVSSEPLLSLTGISYRLLQLIRPYRRSQKSRASTTQLSFWMATVQVMDRARGRRHCTQACSLSCRV